MDRRWFLIAVFVVVAWNLLLFQWFVARINEIHRDISDIQNDLAIERIARLRRDELAGIEASTSSSSSSSFFVTRRLIIDGTTSPPPATTATTLPRLDRPRTTPPITTTTTAPSPSSSSSRALLPIVVFCYNRAKYLQQTLNTLFERRTMPHLHPVVISQDGNDASVAHVAQSFPIAKLLQRTVRTLPEHMLFPSMPAYYHIAIHYGVGLRQTFDMFPDAPGVIILEEDISIAPDALSFFRATLPLLLNDTSLMAVSAFNDNGAGPGHTPKLEALHRADFFPGLGWLMPRRIWDELAPKWPDSFWDDWLRNPEQRRGRHFIRPELSRTHTFGESGASGGQFYKAHLEHNSMNELPFDWETQDLSYLARGAYDTYIDNLIRGARHITAVPSSWRNHANSTVMFIYKNHDEFVRIARGLHLMEDEKSGIPRTAYRGVVLFRVEGNVVILIAQADTVKAVIGR